MTSRVASRANDLEDLLVAVRNRGVEETGPGDIPVDGPRQSPLRPDVEQEEVAAADGSSILAVGHVVRVGAVRVDRHDRTVRRDQAAAAILVPDELLDRELVGGHTVPNPAAGLAKRCEIQVSYAIGVANPTSVSVNTFGTGRLPDARLEKLITAHFDLRPFGIIRMLDLVHPMYRRTASYGHFGREPAQMEYYGRTFTAFSWERTDRAEALRKAARV